MENPLLTESALPFGAPRFDLIKNEHYVPAFKEALRQAKAEIDAIADNPDAPTFENTVEAMEYAGRSLSRVAGIFYNLNEAETNDEMQAIAEEISPMMTEWSMYVSLNPKLFARVKAVWEGRDGLSLEKDQKKLLEDSYKSFVRGGANLSDGDKALFAKWSEELALLSLSFQKNVLASTNAFVLNVTDEADLEGLPQYVVDGGAVAARERGLEGWAFTLDAPSYAPFMKFSRRRELRRRMWTAYNKRGIGGETDNSGNVGRIVELRLKIANLLGYRTYAEYALEERMAKSQANVLRFLDELMAPSLPVAREEVAKVAEFAGADLMPWDFSFWAERYREANFALNEEALKPYFRLESCIEAVFGLAGTLYGISFEPREDIPVYHKDVKVYEVKDGDGSHLALFYTDFFPREGKRNGAWMTEFRGQSIYKGVEERPLISIVTNFTKPTDTDPSLITHDELTTFLHEFGHALHGIMAKGRYESLSGTNVARDFVELPSQIMENWAFEPQWLDSFARHYRTGEVIPDELIGKIVAAKNYLAGYYQVRQLRFGILDMAFHTLTASNEGKEGSDMEEKRTAQQGGESAEDNHSSETALAKAVKDPMAFETEVLRDYDVLPEVPGCAFAPAFGHIFSGGYAAGYYSYKWAEVLEADAFSLFEEKGIFSREVAGAFRRMLEKGGSEDASELYRRFRGHDPEPKALLYKLGILQS